MRIQGPRRWKRCLKCRGAFYGQHRRCKQCRERIYPYLPSAYHATGPITERLEHDA